MIGRPPADRTSTDILAEWKAAEASLDPDAPDSAIESKIARLREELDQAVAREAAASGVPEGASEADIRATSDQLLRDLDVLAALEDQKRALSPGDPELVALAARVDEIAQRVLALTTRQLIISELAETDEGVTRPIEEVPPRPIAAVLADWRAEERRLAAAPAGSVDAREAAARIEGLREEYRRAYAYQARSET